MTNTAVYQLITKDHKKAPAFKSIIWLPADKYLLPIAFYADICRPEAEKKASDWLAEQSARSEALARRAKVANAAKAAKKEKTK